ncbi:MAG: sigma-70 family RNA polymerase sigma factor [Solirubrobacteraceae bacterium]
MSPDTQAAALPRSTLAGNSAGDWFDELYRSSRDDVHAYVAALLGDRATAEDVTALAFERAYRRRRLFNARRGSPRGWLFAIARNAALDELRRRGRTQQLRDDTLAAAAPTSEEQADFAAQRATVRSALARLDAADRELILLKFHAQLTHAELARALGTSESNAGTRLHRAITKLREACR